MLWEARPAGRITAKQLQASHIDGGVLPCALLRRTGGKVVPMSEHRAFNRSKYILLVVTEESNICQAWRRTREDALHARFAKFCISAGSTYGPNKRSMKKYCGCSERNWQLPLMCPPKPHQLRYLRVLFDNKFAKR